MSRSDLAANGGLDMKRLALTVLILGLQSVTSVHAQDALGDGHALDGGLNVMGSRNTAVGTTRPGQANVDALTNPNTALTLTSNADFRAQNLATPQAFIDSSSLYNNPWYWAHAGSLEAEMMAGSGGMGMGGGGVSPVYFAGDENVGTPFWQDTMAGNSSRVQYGGELSAISQLNRPTATYIPPGQDGNVLQSPGGSTPEDFRTPWEYSIGGQSPFLRDVQRNTLMRDNVTNREMIGQPRKVGSGISPNQQMIHYTASNLRGLGLVFPEKDNSQMGLTQYDIMRATEDWKYGRTQMNPGRPYETQISPDLMTSDRISRRISPDEFGTSSPQIQTVMEQMAKRYQELNPVRDQDPTDKFRLDYSQMQQDIAQFQVQSRLDQIAKMDAASRPNLDGDKNDQTSPGPDSLIQNPQEPATPKDVDEDGSVNTKRVINYQDMGMVLRHGQRVNSLSTGDNTRFEELMKAGQTLLDEGKYFWSEKRFARALRFIPGHPLATAGLAHSQIGAGLNLTAALTLKSLLGFQPEMIDVVYDPTLLPAEADIERSINDLQRRLAQDENIDDYGFLLAYIGHQLDRPELIKQGLDAMKKASQDLVLTDLLRSVWLPEMDIELPDLMELDSVVEEEAASNDNATVPLLPADEKVDEAPAPAPVELEPLIDPARSF
ncbi:MAG: hypothetical protein MK089_06305 [Phycisphaerales bacterium]|nr:hypothetical protein [Phycisphaerales bacterium]